MIVQKYGGSLLASPESLGATLPEFQRQHRAQTKVVAVISAMKGETDRLLTLAPVANNPHSRRELDAIIASGELASAAYLCDLLQRHGIATSVLPPHRIGILTDSNFGRANALAVDPTEILSGLRTHDVLIVPGFQGIDKDGNTTTLGRGGSDLSAVLLAASLGAPCQIIKDVQGLYDIDPNICSNAKLFSEITFEDLLLLTSFGAKVIQHKALSIAQRNRITLTVRSLDSKGTTISSALSDGRDNQPPFVGIAHKKGMSSLRITGKTLPMPLNEINAIVNHHHKTLESLRHSSDAYNWMLEAVFTRDQSAQPLVDDLWRLPALQDANIALDEHLVLLTLVARGYLPENTSARLLALGKANGLEIFSLSESLRKISLLLPEQQLKAAANCFYSAFIDSTNTENTIRT